MPLIFTGAPDVVADIEQVIRDGWPSDLGSVDRVGEDITAIAEVMVIAGGEVEGWTREATLSTSHGMWTDLHGSGRGQPRATAETDDVYKERLRRPPGAIVHSEILDAIQALVDVAGGGTAYLIEVPADEVAVVRQNGDPNSYLSFINTGDCRVGGGRGTLVAQVPAGLDVADAALLALRKKRAAGKRYFVEEISPL